MNREILFRGKRTDNGEWVEGNLFIPDYPDKPTEICLGTNIVRITYEVIPGTVGQYTGLTDKNGKRIFEDDIILLGGNIYQIIFECGSFCIYDKSCKMISKIGGINDNCYSLMNLYLECCWEEDWAYDIEVIGNVHDNPDLLEVSE